MVFNLRKRNRKPIKQIRQPRPKFLRHIRRPRRRALDASSVEHVDSDAPALGDDFSEEVHRAIESSVLLVSSNTQVIIFRRYIREYMHPPNTRLGSAPLFMKQHHEAAFRSTWSPYVGGASSYATMFQTEAQQVTLEDQQLGPGETRSTQANIQPRDYVSWSCCLLCQERHLLSIPSLLLCSLTCRKLRRLQVAGDLQLNSSYRAPQPILQRQIDGLSRLSWMALDRVWLLWVHNLT